jgi:uncharacterized protein (TIGR02145 family)
MNNRTHFFQFIAFLLLMANTGCEKTDNNGISTLAVSQITINSAMSGGNIPSDGGNPVSAYGVCWATHSLPSLSDEKSVDGSGTGKFTSHVTGLQPLTRYYLRAYATNKIGTSYGAVVTFITKKLPTVTTANVTRITHSTAKSGGSISNATATDILARGVCWSTNAEPTINDSKTNEEPGIGAFTSNLTELASGTTYFVRAYATNDAGTSYGNQIEFTTVEDGIVYDYQGNMYQTIVLNNKTWMAENLRAERYSNGDAIAKLLNNSAWANTTLGACVVYSHVLGNGVNSSDEMLAAYGMLYNWHAVVDVRNICPIGWRLPTIGEWTELINSLGIAGAGNLKSCRQINSPLGGVCATNSHPRWRENLTFYGTNSSNFGALPSGMRYSEGTYVSLGEQGSWWSSTEQGSLNAWLVNTYFNSGSIEKSVDRKTLGLSVRCIKN